MPLTSICKSYHFDFSTAGPRRQRGFQESRINDNFNNSSHKPHAPPAVLSRWDLNPEPNNYRVSQLKRNTFQWFIVLRLEGQ